MANLRIHPLTYYKYPIDHPYSIIGDDINRALNDLAVMIGAEQIRVSPEELKDFEG